ncbi:unnamed protein product [Meloidogyne enterolobii]|uniref:Uncharacterized protein n=1 Tax=Meloidogyne enterolobii TaxID=390850 RepID=A0ACB1A6H5_MELEN
MESNGVNLNSGSQHCATTNGGSDSFGKSFSTDHPKNSLTEPACVEHVVQYKENSNEVCNFHVSIGIILSLLGLEISPVQLSIFNFLPIP